MEAVVEGMEVVVEWHGGGDGMAVRWWWSSMEWWSGLEAVVGTIVM